MLTSLTCAKGDLVGNLVRHRGLMESAGDHGCDLVLLPEMSLTGYRPSAAVVLDHPAVTELVAATLEGPALCFGLVETDHSGGRPFITQLIADHGQIVAVHRKSHLGEGEETDFRPGAAAAAFVLADATCVVAVCAEIGTGRPYAHDGVRVVLGPSAPGLYGDRRRTDADWRRGWDWWRSSVIDDAARLLSRDLVLVSPPKPAPPTTRTSPAGQPSWNRAAPWPPSYRTGARAPSSSTSDVGARHPADDAGLVLEGIGVLWWSFPGETDASPRAGVVHSEEDACLECS